VVRSNLAFASARTAAKRSSEEARGACWFFHVKRRVLLDENTLLSQLEELAQSLKIEVRYESFKGEVAFSTGGLCKLKGEYLLIINSKASVREKAEAIAGALKRFDLGQVYLRPGLREFLDGVKETAAFS